MELDLIDRKLIYELDLDSRKPLSQIAKKLRLNRNVLLYRLERLKKEGIIRGTFTQINNFALGYMSYRVFVKLGNCTADQEHELINELKRQKNLLWLSRVLGKWDLDIIYMAKTIQDFESFNDHIQLKYNSIIEDYEISILIKINDYDKDFIIDNKRETIVKKKSIVPTEFPLDETHISILQNISENATINILDLSKKVHASINTVKKKLKELQKNKVILAFRLLLDTNKLGYQYFKLHIALRNYTESDLQALTTFLESKNFMISTDHYLGRNQFEIELNLKSEDDYIKFFDELKQKFGKIIKDQYFIKFYDELVYRYLPTL